MVGDLVEDAWQSVLTLAAGSSATAREAIGREVEAMRDRLAAKATSGLEKLVIDHLVLCWLVVYHAERELARHLRDPLGPGPNLRAADRRLDQARTSSREANRALVATRLRLKPPLSAREPEVRLAPEMTVDPASGPPRSA